MGFLKKLKETFIAILPLAVIFIFINLLLVWTGSESIPTQTAKDFFVACVLLVLGQVVFLVGIDNSLNTMGEMIGAATVKLKKIWLILPTVFVFGFLITIADPDIQVLSALVNDVIPGSGGFLLMAVVALGVGIYIVLSFIKTLFNIKFKYIILFSYIVAFVLAVLSPPGFVALAFDSGGVITGPITVPFILALGIGAAAVRSENSSDSFGTVALAAVGPIIAILIFGLLSGQDGTALAPQYPHQPFGEIFGATLWDVFVGVAPIAVMFFVFQAFFIKLPKKKLLSVALGVGLVYIGLVLFLAGINYGFSAAGYYIGYLVTNTNFDWILLPVAAIIGISTVFTEPSIKVLGEQVEEVTSGSVSKKTLTLALAAGVGLAVLLGVVKIMFSISFWWFIVPCFLVAITFAFFSPDVFTTIAFDAGGVASGPITATFTLPLVIGIASALGESVLLYAFGLVTMVSIMPPIIVQSLGLISRLKENRIAHLEREELAEIERLTEGIDTEMFRRMALEDFDFSGLLKSGWKHQNNRRLIRHHRIHKISKLGKKKECENAEQ